MIICTVTTASHLYRAKVMARSAKKHYPTAMVIVCLVERKMHPTVRNTDYFDRVVLANNLKIMHFEELLQERNIHETAFVLKGHFIQFLFRHYPDEHQLMMLDTDVQVLSPFDEVHEALKTYPIVLTPHELTDQKAVYLFHGIFNIGFIALSRSEETERFLEWWIGRVDRYCFDRCYSLGLFYEQNWLNLAPAYFPVHILQHPGYNVAFWNWGERGDSIVRTPGGQYMVKGEPIRFFHFSNLTGKLAQTLRKELHTKHKAIRILYYSYLKQLKSMGQNACVRIPWSYDGKQF